MEPPILVGGDTGLLLGEVVGIGPACHARICSLFGRQLGEACVGAEVGGVPTEKHPGITSTATLLEQVEERDSRPTIDARVARDPLQGMPPSGIGLWGLHDVPGLVGVGLVPADEPARLTVRARDVLGGQDLQEAMFVAPLESRWSTPLGQ